MKPVVTGIDLSGGEDDRLALQVEFSDEGGEFPRSAGVEVWVERDQASQLTLAEVQDRAIEDAYAFLTEILDSRG